MSTSQLYVRCYANYWTRKEIGEDVRKLEAEPVHVLLHDGLQTPIILAPREALERISALEAQNRQLLQRLEGYQRTPPMEMAASD